MGTKWGAFIAAAAGIVVLDATAAPAVQGISITLDKPAYNSTYALGVRAYVQPGDAVVVDVAATHNSTSSGSVGSWSLSDSGPYWWAWASQHVSHSTGPLDGSIEIIARDANGESATLSVPLQPDQEMNWPTSTITWTGRSFSIDGTAVERADYYNLWLWDPIDRYYPSSQQVTNPAELSDISAENLIAGRTYNLYWMANNYVDTGLDGYTSLYRSYTLQYVTVPAMSVPEPSTVGLVALALGLAVLGGGPAHQGTLNRRLVIT